MGVFYDSICLPGSQADRVRQTLARWLALKGFAPSAEPVLFDLDGDHERRAYLLSSLRWTVVVYSHYDEQRRLIRELLDEHQPLLYVWVHDSDVWGWDLFAGGGFRGSFSSDPRAHCSFADEEPGTAERPWADPGELARELGVAERAEALRRMARRSSAFKEEVCRGLCREIGAEPAMSTYDELEAGIQGLDPDWRCTSISFVDQDWDGDRPGTLLHDYDVARRQTFVGFLPDPMSGEFPRELLVEVERMRHRAQLKMRLLKPVSWIARLWRRLHEAASATRPRPEIPETRNYHRDARGLVNDRHRCRITLAEGLMPAPTLNKPSSVFAFDAGTVRVTCTARRRSQIAEALRKPSGSRVTADEKLSVGGLDLRHLVFEQPPGATGRTGPTFLALSVVQAERALYVFLWRTPVPLPAKTELAIRATVESFRPLGGLAPTLRDRETASPA